MIKADCNDTIAAVATPIGEAGIGIVRISGKDALAIADKLFVSRNKQKPSQAKTHTMHYGWIIDAASAGKEIIDEVILTVMRSPRSYTKEDIVEINCHGGIIALRSTLDVVLASGARLAEPGEFTQRAFLNGRIDLAQAEAVLDIIRAKTDSALKISLAQLKGALSKQISSIRRVILDVLSALEANIDFPDEEISPANLNGLAQHLKNTEQKLQGILQASGYGRILREGVNVVICGRPNVGKSSLLNSILRQERAIVTPVAGTTRDTIEEIINIKGIPIKIVDTAGIIEPRDLVEKKAVLRAKEYMRLADLVILVFDGSKKLTADDRELIKRLNKKTVLALVNKIDLKQKIEKDKIVEIFDRFVSVSAKKNKNIRLLEDAIFDLICKARLFSPEPVLVTNLRHIECLKGVQKFIARAANSLDNALSFEFIAQDLKDALMYLDEIVGRRFSEDLLDKIFSEFCIGK